MSKGPPSSSTMISQKEMDGKEKKYSISYRLLFVEGRLSQLKQKQEAAKELIEEYKRLISMFGTIVVLSLPNSFL